MISLNPEQARQLLKAANAKHTCRTESSTEVTHLYIIDLKIKIYERNRHDGETEYWLLTSDKLESIPD